MRRARTDGARAASPSGPRFQGNFFKTPSLIYQLAVTIAIRVGARSWEEDRLALEESNIVVVFILSAPYSGSTWLNLVLGSHSWAMNLGEYYRPFLNPDHIACRLCEAEGLPECTVLHGIEAVARADAYHFAALRSGKRILIDASKRLD